MLLKNKKYLYKGENNVKSIKLKIRYRWRYFFIKKAYTNLLLGVEVDEEKQYIYVTTMYPITDRKIENRIYSGKLINIKKNK